MTETLPILKPDAARGARTKARCHDLLAARRRRVEAPSRPPGPRALAAERLVVAGLCTAYLIAMAGDILRVVGTL
jgi:hypothetical protein